jgi:hypothetical protein
MWSFLSNLSREGFFNILLGEGARPEAQEEMQTLGA